MVDSHVCMSFVCRMLKRALIDHGLFGSIYLGAQVNQSGRDQDQAIEPRS